VWQPTNATAISKNHIKILPLTSLVSDFSAKIKKVRRLPSSAAMAVLGGLALTKMLGGAATGKDQSGKENQEGKYDSF